MMPFPPSYERELVIASGLCKRRLEVSARSDLAVEASGAAGPWGPASPALDAERIVRAFVAGVDAGCFASSADHTAARLDLLERQERDGKRHERFSVELPALEARALGALVRLADANVFWGQGIEAFVVRELDADAVAATDPTALWKMRLPAPALPFAAEIPDAVELKEQTVLVRLATLPAAPPRSDPLTAAQDRAERWAALASAGAFGGQMLPFSSCMLESVRAPYDDEIALHFAHLDCTRDGWIAFVLAFVRFHEEFAPLAAIELD